MGILKYKYNFLREWMAATDKSMKDVKEAVGNSSNNNIHDWLGDGPAQKRQQERGEEIRPVAMNVESIVKICNAFKVPIESFFVEEGSRVQPMAFSLSEVSSRVFITLDTSPLKYSSSSMAAFPASREGRFMV
jgi:hypothetical protein